MFDEGAGDSCDSCGLWIQATGDWFCEECAVPTCERCGKLDHVEEVFLCPECFCKDAPPKKLFKSEAEKERHMEEYIKEWEDQGFSDR